MRNKKPLMIIATCLLLVSAFAVIPVFSAQPPIDTTTYYVGTIGQPRRVDPARAYDTASGELIMNVYETLIFFNHTILMPDATANISQVGMSNLTYGPENPSQANFRPVLATALPTISADGKQWNFTIRSGVQFHPWKAANGSVITGQIMTAEDVEYSFKKALVQDMYGSPSWMFTMPMFNTMFLDQFDADGDTNTIEPVGVNGAGERLVASMIDAAIVRDGNVISFNLYDAFPKTAFAQILSQTWACIVNKAFSVENGCWNGTFYDGWSTDYRRMPSNLYGPMDRYYAAKSKYTSATSPITLYGGAMCGTGPYYFNYWDKSILRWRADRFAGYWNADARPHLDTIIVTGIPEWPTRKMMFLSGEFDSLAVPRANMYDLLQAGQAYVPISGITLYYDAPALSNDVASFVLEVDPYTPYMPKVPIGGAPRRDFFKDPHVRTAFAYSLNFTTYLRDAWFNEAIQPTSWWVDGLAPTAAKNTSLVPHNLDKSVIQAELTAAGLWTSGFETYLVYNLGNDQRKIACDMMAETINSLGPQFKVNVIGLDWPVFLDYEEMYYMPMFFVGWLADFAHPDNFARPYMHSYGDFAYFQKYNDTHVDWLIDHAIWEVNEATQIAYYQELQYIYWRDNPGLPLIQGLGRRWQRDWVRGWYYNQLYPGMCFYDLYKATPATVQNVDVSAVGSITQLLPYKYPVIHVFHGETRVGYNGTVAVYNKWTTTWNVTVHRTDNNLAVAILWVSLGLKRTSGAISKYPAANYTAVGPGGSAWQLFTWYEDGVALVITAANWTVGGESGVLAPTYANDTNTGNNYVADGFQNAKALVGDINGDGLVDILDAIKLSAAFGKKTGEKGWNADCDLKVDGVIDIFDAILLAGNFGKYVSAVWP